jgi:hypothetical protein
MVNIFNKATSKPDFLKRIGHISQVADAREGRMVSGKGDGVATIDVKTGSGFNFTVLPSRCMDIAWADYCGVPISYISKAGVVHPSYYEKDGLGFLRSFTCGLVTTCGLTYMGAPCDDNGELLGLHGRVSNIPATDVGVCKEWEGNEFVIRIRGKVNQAGLFLENMCLTREIVIRMRTSSLRIKDTIENMGFKEQPLMQLYHCNFGYPIVSEDTVLLTSRADVTARDKHALAGINSIYSCQPPTAGYVEQVFYHQFIDDGVRDAYACLMNPEMGLGAYVLFRKDQFSHFVQWKMMGEGEYVVGLEPSNAKPEGRDKARSGGELELLEPGDKKVFEFEIGVVESENALMDLKLE